MSGAMQRILSMWWVTLALSVATMLAVSVSQPIVDLKITKAQQDLLTLQAVLDDYKTKRGALPGEQDGLAALVGVSLGRAPVDPWGSPYVYRRTGQDEVYRVYSRGLDGRDDGGAEDDVTTVAKTYRCADYGVNCPPTVLGLLMWSALSLAGASLIVGLVRAARYFGAGVSLR
jgi:general secretion pathway protein G